MNNLISSPTDNDIIVGFVKNPVLRCILNIYGPNGFGKSALLKFVEENFRSEVNPIGYVQARNFIKPENSFDIEALIKHLISQLEIRDSMQLPDDLLGLTSYLLNLISLLLSEDKKPILLVDDFDALPETSKWIFVDKVLSELVSKNGDVKFILTSGKELSFKEHPEIYAYCDSRSINVLSEPDIKPYLSGREDLEYEVLRWSCGLPPMITYLLNEFNERKIFTLSDYRQHENDILGSNYRTAIRSTVFPDLINTSDDVVDALSILRRFDFAILGVLLPKLYPAKFSAFKPKDYLIFVRELGDRVYWRDEGAYAINNIIRGMLTSYMRVFELDTYQSVHQIAEETYKKWLENSFRPHYVSELAYHSLALQKSQGITEVSISDTVSSMIIDQIKARKWENAHELDLLDRLLHLLKSDKDVRPFLHGKVINHIEETLLI